MTCRVTVSSITDRGVEPQYFGTFASKDAADQYAKDFRKLAAAAGVMIRIDVDHVIVGSVAEQFAADLDRMNAEREASSSALLATTREAITKIRKGREMFR